jgi:hypothetical protein
MERYRRWWLDRFSLEEIQEMAEALWPNDSGRDLVLDLVPD